MMIIDDLLEVKKSLEPIYPNFNNLKSYTLLKLVKKIIIKYDEDLSQKEILKFINDVFNLKIEYANFNKFYISFCRNFDNKKEVLTNKKESKNDNEEIKIASNKSVKNKVYTNLEEADNLKQKNIVSEKNKNNNNDNKVNKTGDKASTFLNLSKVEISSVGLIESENKDKFK